jgi:predicted nucleic acid-binding protein
MNVHCFDTSALIEITHAGPNATKFAKALSKAETVSISTISLYEIARYTTHAAGETATAEILAFLYQYHITPVTSEIAELAASLAPKHKLAMADAIIYATAKTQNATLWTQDDDFKDLPNVKYLPKIKF